MNDKVWKGVAAVALVIAVIGVFTPVVDQVVGRIGTAFPHGLCTGAACDVDTDSELEVNGVGQVTGLLTLDGGQLNSKTIATSTTATAQTLVQADILNYDTILLTPNTGSLTLTFPASSTLTSYVPTAGDMQTTCLVNASSTSGITIALAAGTGINLQSATSTSGGLGAPTIGPLSVGCWRAIRLTNTDINIESTTFKDTD